ncbi:hypothetical protein [[Flexibacter] sp. ATCC 35208]|uniref:hypothetical protein n=1 Tax=[Flexibacter] sp. ATCC 35208 TaxID=1936242 RepID=UPI0009D15C55|nr:hypothetical protein [[Flexibacter] sp. ATCC 35208]OMP80141.1 hypothetical protein BW716_06510 [[Flexibacter] sp. ATCC 35208]
MKNNITPQDFFCLLEMIAGRVSLEMNELAYKKILGATFGETDYSRITKIIPNLNGNTITFNNDMAENKVTIKAKYTPYTKEEISIELI